jgi:hypothetical protein
VTILDAEMLSLASTSEAFRARVTNVLCKTDGAVEVMLVSEALPLVVQDG